MSIKKRHERLNQEKNDTKNELTKKESKNKIRELMNEKNTT